MSQVVRACDRGRVGVHGWQWGLLGHDGGGVGGLWGGQSQGGAWVHAGDAQSGWGQAEGRSVECGAPKGGLWVAIQVR